MSILCQLNSITEWKHTAELNKTLEAFWFDCWVANRHWGGRTSFNTSKIVVKRRERLEAIEQEKQKVIFRAFQLQSWCSKQSQPASQPASQPTNQPTNQPTLSSAISQLSHSASGLKWMNHLESSPAQAQRKVEKFNNKNWEFLNLQFLWRKVKPVQNNWQENNDICSKRVGLSRMITNETSFSGKTMKWFSFMSCDICGLWSWDFSKQFIASELCWMPQWFNVIHHWFKQWCFCQGVS